MVVGILTTLRRDSLKVLFPASCQCRYSGMIELNSNTDSGSLLLSLPRRIQLFLPQASRETEAKTDKNMVCGKAGVSAVHYDGVTRNCTTYLRRW